MTSYSHTKSRALQWLGIIAILCIFGGAYWYYSVRAGVTVNTSQNDMMTSGLVGLWSFDGGDVSGTTAYDRSGSGNNGTLTNGPTQTIGQLGQALDFFPNGADADTYVTMGDPVNGSLDFGSGDFTVGFWMKGRGWVSQGSSANSPLAKKNLNTASAEGYIFSYPNTHLLSFTVANGSTDFSVVQPKATAGDGLWHHYVGVRSGSSIVLFVDGVSVGSTGSVTGSVSNNNNFRVGTESSSNHAYRNANAVLDEVRVYNRALSATEIQSLYALGQSDKVNSAVSQPQGTGRLDSGLAGYWKLDDGSGGTAVDSSTNGNNGTLTNGPTWTTGQIGSAVDFDGADDYTTIPDADTLDIVDSRNFTLSGWFNRDTFTTDDTIIAKSNGQTAADTGYNVYIDDATDKVTFLANDGTDQYKMESVSTFTVTGWHHYSLVWDDSGSGQTKLYINGVPEAATTTGTFGNVNSLTNALTLRLGAESDNGNPFDGKLDEARLYHRALSADEVSQLYRLTAPTGVDTGLKGYWSFNGKDISGTTAYDRSGAGNNGTLTNGPTQTIGKLGQALTFDGGDDYISLPSGGFGSLFGNSNHSVSVWVKTNSVGTRQIVVGDWNAAGMGESLRMEITAGGQYLYGVSGNTGGSVATAGGTVDTNWHFLVGTFDDNANIIALYIDGQLTATTSQSNAMSNGNTKTIGRAGAYNGFYFNGMLDEVRVYNRALSATEIQSLYALGQSDKVNSAVSQPQGTGRLDSGLAGYWKFDETTGSSAADASTNGYTGTLQNMENGDWVAGQIGNGLDFDGSNEYISTGTTLTSADSITLSAWVNASTAAEMAIFGNINGQTGSDFQCLIYDTAGTENIWFGNIVINATVALGTNTWRHVVYTNNGTTNVIYLDGVKRAENTAGALTTASENNVEIGSCISSGGRGKYFSGKIDEARVYHRALSADEVSQLYRLTTPTAVDTSLKGYWSFNGKDISGTTAYDRSGAGNTGTLTNGPTQTIGKLGQALSFDGGDDLVAFSVISGLGLPTATSEITVCSWIKTTAGGSNNGQSIWTEYGGGGSYIMALSIDGYSSYGATNGQILLQLRGNGGVNSYYLASTVQGINNGQWRHVCWTRNASKVNSLYVDGVFSNSGTDSLSAGITPTAANTGIGKSAPVLQNYPFTGGLDEMRVYNRALSADEIKSLYNQAR